MILFFQVEEARDTGAQPAVCDYKILTVLIVDQEVRGLPGAFYAPLNQAASLLQQYFVSTFERVHATYDNRWSRAVPQDLVSLRLAMRR